MAAKVELQALGHCTFKGTRGESGGAPSKNSLWGVAFIGGTLVTFGGRVGGNMRFKTHKKADLPAVMDTFTNGKLTGFPFGKKIDARYSDVTDKAAEWIPDLEKTLGGQYYAAVKNLKVNTRATAKKAKEAA
jgi:hypothetical protein